MVTRDIVVEDVLYDTVLSTAFIAYDAEKKENRRGVSDI